VLGDQHYRRQQDHGVGEWENVLAQQEKGAAYVESHTTDQDKSLLPEVQRTAASHHFCCCPEASTS
jgi:hypothetical protein